MSCNPSPAQVLGDIMDTDGRTPKEIVAQALTAHVSELSKRIELARARGDLPEAPARAAQRSLALWVKRPVEYLESREYDCSGLCQSPFSEFLR